MHLLLVAEARMTALSLAEAAMQPNKDPEVVSTTQLTNFLGYVTTHRMQGNVYWWNKWADIEMTIQDMRDKGKWEDDAKKVKGRDYQVDRRKMYVQAKDMITDYKNNPALGFFCAKTEIHSRSCNRSNKVISLQFVERFFSHPIVGLASLPTRNVLPQHTTLRRLTWLLQ